MGRPHQEWHRAVGCRSQRDIPRCVTWHQFDGFSDGDLRNTTWSWNKISNIYVCIYIYIYVCIYIYIYICSLYQQFLWNVCWDSLIESTLVRYVLLVKCIKNLQRFQAGRMSSQLGESLLSVLCCLMDLTMVYGRYNYSSWGLFHGL